MRKRTGLSTEPWRTPDAILHEDDNTPFKTTCCDRSDFLTLHNTPICEKPKVWNLAACQKLLQSQGCQYQFAVYY